MSKLKKYKFFGSRSTVPVISNVALAAATPTHARSISHEIANDLPDSHPVDRSDLSLDLSIAGFKTLKEVAEVIPVAGGPLKASCGIMISILQLAKRCKENRESWEKLADMMKEKNESIIALLDLYSKAPAEYPSAGRQAKEYQQVLDSIALDIKKETQRKSESSQGLEMYWSRMQSAGREMLLANINAEKITSYQERLRTITFDVIEKTVIHQAITTTQKLDDIKIALTEQRTTVAVLTEQTSTVASDVKTILAESSGSKAPKAILKPRPRKARDFVGRKDILDSMCKTHFDNDNSSLHDDGPIVSVLTGMGGSGKTQIAVNFASLFEKRFPETPVFFLDASSETSLNADLITLVRSQTDKYDDALTWLASGIKNWLLILDNADDPSLKLSKFLPRASHGHVIITTRNSTHRLLAPRSSHAVDALPMEDSITLLLRSSGNEDNEANRSLAKEIAEGLGRLPLALAHAAAYILINNCLDAFLATYRASRNQFLQSMPDLPQDYPYSVERTIEMSFRCLSVRVQEMLVLFTYMDARSIARCIVERAAKRKFLHIPQESEVPPQPDTIVQAKVLQDIFCSGGEWNAFEFDGMIGECLKYSLLQMSTTGGERFYSMHPLVQTYLQSISSTVRGCSTRRLIVRLLASATTTGDRYEFFGFNRLLSPHVRLVRLGDIVEAGDHYGFGDILSEEGNGFAISHLEQCVEIWKVSVGSNTKPTLDSMAMLSNSYYSLGKVQEALQLDEEVFQKWKQLFGPDHLYTLHAMNNLADSYRSLGRVEEALPLQEEVLPKRRQLLGPDHLHTLSAMNNLAASYSSLGRVEEALQLQEEVFQKRKQLLGPDHLETLIAMGNLAISYNSSGRARDALSLEKEVLEKRKRLLGPDHRDTLWTMRGLLRTFRQLDMEQDLKSLAEAALPLHERVYGVGHDKTEWVRRFLR
ncbi:hypothetical protein FRC20_011914 [Serendipita sp. 405]|nr:hypothetical protein FRC15_006724 [Serendipita sp. 397]KAG8859016.1 hypothetical protein FRC20_011914 [Serendipita sp. 405]